MFKLVKKTRQLGSETFLGSIDAVVAKNWSKKVFDTLTDMELDDELKLRVVTRLDVTSRPEKGRHVATVVYP